MYRNYYSQYSEPTVNLLRKRECVFYCVIVRAGIMIYTHIQSIYIYIYIYTSIYIHIHTYKYIRRQIRIYTYRHVCVCTRVWKIQNFHLYTKHPTMKTIIPRDIQTFPNTKEERTFQERIWMFIACIYVQMKISVFLNWCPWSTMTPTPPSYLMFDTFSRMNSTQTISPLSRWEIFSFLSSITYVHTYIYTDILIYSQRHSYVYINKTHLFAMKYLFVNQELYQPLHSLDMSVCLSLSLGQSCSLAFSFSLSLYIYICIYSHLQSFLLRCGTRPYIYIYIYTGIS